MTKRKEFGIAPDSFLLEAVLKPLKKFVNEGQLDHSLGRVHQKLIVDSQASEVLQPGERALYYPSFGKYRELGRAFVRAEYNFHCPSKLFGHPIAKSPVISSNTPSSFHFRK